MSAAATQTVLPKISVIMGTYNPDERIEAAISSIIEQTEKDWEFIICDDGSDEVHAKYLEKVCLVDSRIRLIRNTCNKGLAYSLNRCLKLSKGKYIARMDDDDISMPERFACQIQFLQDNPQYGWVGTQAILYDEHGEWGVGERTIAPETKDYLPFSPYIHSSVMFRAEVLKKAKGYRVNSRTRLCEDYELFMRLHAEGERGYNLQDKLLRYYEDRNRAHHRTLAQYFYECQIRATGFSRMELSPAETILYSVKPFAVSVAAGIPGFYQTAKKYRRRGNFGRSPREQSYRNILKDDPIMERAVCESQSSFNGPKGQTVQNTVTAMVLAPVLNYFTQWVLTQADRLGMKRLYFLSRDGYLMYKNTLDYCKAYHPDIECRFLYCSRYSLRVPLYHRDMDQAIEHIFRNGIDVTLRRILLRTGVMENGVDDLAERLKIEKDLLDKTLTFQKLKAWKSILCKNKVFTECISDHSKSCWRELIGYFSQEGLLDDVPIAIVDSGWTGTTQESIQQILHEMGSEVKLHGLYFGLYEIPSSMNKAVYHSFYFSPENKLFRKVRFANCLFEGLYSAPFGTTISYSQDNGRYRPVLQECNVSTMKGIQTEEAVISEITNRYLTYCIESGKTTIDETPKSLEMTQRLLETLMWSPSRDEAEVLGDILFSDDLLDMDTQKMAPEFDDRELFKNHLPVMVFNRLGVLDHTIHESAWFCGTAMKNGKFFKWHRGSNGAYKAITYLRKAAFRKRQ